MAPNVLLIDDDVNFCSAVSEHLASQGVDILIATDPSILQLINLDELKVILLDIDMPVLSGFEVLAEIKGRNSDVTVIMVSGHSDLNTRLKCLEEGADFFLAKPIDMQELALVTMRAGRRKTIAAEPEARWKLSRTAHSLFTPNGDKVGLSAAEYKVLEVLFVSAPEVASKEALSKAATGRDDRALAYGRGLEVLISRIRSRANVGRHKLPVKALRNVGYVFHGDCHIED